MNAASYRFAITALLVAAPSLALAGPLKVSAAGSHAQKSMTCVCPDCGHSMAVSQAGDYAIVFSADTIQPKTGAARFAIGVTDRRGQPVTDAKVALTLTMPAHHHGPVTLTASGGKGGRYAAVSTLDPHMRGKWRADVQITPPAGAPVTQSFTFEQ